MLILLSPAKTLKFTPIDFKVVWGLPVFLDQSKVIVDRMKELSLEEISHLMAISPALAQLNYERFHQWTLPITEANATPALWTFMGDVYKGLDAASFSKDEALFAQSTIRILSGLYGVLRPFDLMQAYRLEMGSKLMVGESHNLYRYWDKQIASYLLAELNGQPSNVIINLASQEYYKAVESISEQVRVITPSFYETSSGKAKMVAIHAKRARGLMTRFVVEERITNSDHLKAFSSEGYLFSEPLSKGDRWAFVR